MNNVYVSRKNEKSDTVANAPDLDNFEVNLDFQNFGADTGEDKDEKPVIEIVKQGNKMQGKLPNSLQ